jgi:hydroxypyruvate reductase
MLEVKTVNKPVLLAAGFLPPDQLSELQTRYDVLEWYKADNPAAILSSFAKYVRCVVGTSHANITATLLNQLPALEQVSIYGAGYDNVDIVTLKKRGIRLTHTPGVNTDDVADLGMAFILATARQVVEADRFVRSGKAQNESMPFSNSLTGSKVGIAGLGTIGYELARRAEIFKVELHYHNRKPRQDVTYTYHKTLLSLAEAVDFLVLCMPGGESTEHCVNTQVLAALGKKGILINIGRGSLVDEEALYEALTSGIIAGAAIDVFKQLGKPTPKFEKLENVLLSPHRGSATFESRAAMGSLFIANIDALYEGVLPPAIAPHLN